MRCVTACAAFVAIIGIGIGFLVNDIISGMRYDQQLRWQDDSCQLLKTSTPCEDLTAYGDGHSAFAGCGDLWNTFMRGSAGVPNGGIYLVNATKGTIRQLQVFGADGQIPKLVVHGMHYGQQSRKLYAVNHDEEHGESVEVFDLKGFGEELYLKHAMSLRSELFGNMALNDVVEGGRTPFIKGDPWHRPRVARPGHLDELAD